LFEQKALKKEEIIYYLNSNYINISVNSDINTIVANKFGVRGVPALFFLKPDSERISGVPGYVAPEVFFRMLKYIHSNSYETMNFTEYNRSSLGLKPLEKR
jgi:thioredoxin-related protein